MNQQELNEMAQGIADVTREILYDSVDWQLDYSEASGNNYNELHNYVMSKAIELLYEQTEVRL
jgi:hypothetical protein|tara:strand:+ start:1288 stop:1476 length:189 start_codon:yes stop_codon:yes gene_type:complete